MFRYEIWMFNMSNIKRFFFSLSYRVVVEVVGDVTNNRKGVMFTEELQLYNAFDTITYLYSISLLSVLLD